MIYQVILPSKELSNIVSYFWIATWDASSQGANSIHYTIANSLTEITFAFNGDAQGSELLFSTIQGQSSKPDNIPVKGFYHLLGVSFYPHALPSLFNIPAGDLNNQFISLNTFLGREGSLLTERIALAGTNEKRIQILSSYFLSLSLCTHQEDPDKLIINAMDQIKRTRGSVKIKDLSKEYGLSQKQFKRRFKVSSGFNPKTYSRIIRFESVVKNKEHWSNLAEAAYANGYYDQAHLNREFKSFTGFSPMDFWKLSE